jgi:hypothetical protein
MRKRLVSIALIVLGLGAIAPVAIAQVPQYPPVPISVCIRLLAGVRNGRPVLRFDERIVLFGPPGCGLVGERLRLILESTPIVIGQTTVAEDGSFRIEANLPPEIVPGTHRLVVDQGKTQIIRPVEVISAQALGATKPVAGGRGLAVAAMWTILLLAGVTALMLFGWKRVAVPVRARRRSHLGLDGAGVPHIDTTRFVPLRRRRDEVPQEPQDKPGETRD